MTDTYSGWDGKSYPWPPPDGWYEASDGRWWAPGTGPNPPPAANEPSAAPAAQPPIDEAVARTAQLPTHGAQAAGYNPAADAPSQQGPSQQAPSGFDPGLTAQVQVPDRAAATPTTTFSAGPPPGGSGGGNADWDGGAATSSPSAGRSRAASLLLVTLGALVAVALAGGAYLLLRSDGSDTATNSTDQDEQTDTSDGGSDSTEDQREGDGDGESPTTDGTVDPDEDTSTTADEDTTTSEGDTSTTEGDTSTTADASGQVSSFRSILADNGLTSDGLSDDQITTFGTTFCVFAVASESQTEYSEFREQAIAETDSGLSEEDLFLVIDTAVVVFCPDEADRLGIEQ